MLRNEFKPPSDFVSNDSGSGGGRNIWKILGIGCLVVMILVGIALAFGAWQTVSCCGSAKDFFVKGTMAREMGLAVGNDLKREKYESIRAKMTPTLASEISVEQLRGQREEYASFIEQASPHFLNIAKQSEEDDKWGGSVEFAPPKRAEKLVLLIGIQSTEGQESDQPVLKIESLVFEQRKRDLQAEPASVAVLEFHRELRRGNDELAFNIVQSKFSDMTAFRAFLEEQKPVFREGAIEIESVENQVGRSVVVAQVGGADAERVRVEYELGPARGAMDEFEIRKITPTYQKAAAQGVDEADSDASKSDAGADDSAEADAAK